MPRRPTPTTITCAAVGTGSGLLISSHLPLLAALATGLIAGITAAVFLGVILPAVWSTRSTRRAAAQGVLTQLLTLLHRPTPLR
jgi:hypothetical protein